MLRGCRLSFKYLSNDKKSEEILLGSYSVLFRLLFFMAKWPRRLFTSLVRSLASQTLFSKGKNYKGCGEWVEKRAERESGQMQCFQAPKTYTIKVVLC